MKKRGIIRVLSVLMVVFMLEGILPIYHVRAADDVKKHYTVLVLDTSNEAGFLDSSGDTFYTAPTALEYVKKAAVRFLLNVGKTVDENYVAIVSFKDIACTVSDFSDNYDDLTEKINGLYASSDIRDISSGLSAAMSLLSGVDETDADKNVVLFTTGMTNNGKYNYDGVFNNDTVGSKWRRNNTGIRLYAYANHAFEIAEEIKKSGITFYTVGLFQTMENMPELGKSVVELFQLTARQLASSDDCYFPVEDPEMLELTFGEIADVINKIATVTGTLGDYITVVFLDSEDSYDAIEIDDQEYRITDNAGITKDWVDTNKGRYVKAILANEEIISIVSYLTTDIDSNGFIHRGSCFFNRFFNDYYRQDEFGNFVYNSDGTYAKMSESEREKYEKKFTYEISDEKFNELLNWCSKFYDSTEKNSFNKKLLKKERRRSWGGSCFGISATMALSFKGTVKISDVFDSGDKYFHMNAQDWPANNNELRDLINYYQLAQYVNAWQHYDLDKKGYIIKQNQETKNKIISDMIDYALTCDTTGEPFVICMSYSHDSLPDKKGKTKRETGGHAIVGVGVEYSDENTTSIRIVDPNDFSYDGTQYNYMILSKNESGDYSISFERNYTSDRNYDFNSINYVSMEELRVVDYYGNSNSDRYNVPTSTFIFGINEDITIIDKTTGKKFVYRKGETSGDITVFDFYRYYNDAEDVNDCSVGFELELGDEYEIITDGEVDLTIGNENGFVGIDVENGDRIDLNLNNGFTITGDDIDYNIFVDVGDSENLINISGSGKGEVKVNESDDSVIITGNEIYVDTCDYLYDASIVSKEYDLTGNGFEFGAFSDHVELLEHKWDSGKITKNPTCEEPGEMIFTCSVCGETNKSQEELPALGHSFKDGVCTVCGAIDPDYKLVLRKGSNLILDNNKMLIYIEPERTSGVTVSELKEEIEGDIKLALSDSSVIANGFNFNFGTNEYTVIVIGDTSSDGKITANDARDILRIAAKLETPDELTKEAADIDFDGKITSSEARSVLRFAAKLQSKICE